MKVLVASDDDMTMRGLTYGFLKENIDAFYASNGEDALQLALNRQPDIIITELMLSSISGLELITHIREKAKLDTPIIVVSKVGLKDKKEEALSLGASDYLLKPIDFQKLMIHIKLLTKK